MKKQKNFDSAIAILPSIEERSNLVTSTPATTNFAEPLILDQSVPFFAKKAGILMVQAVTSPGRGSVTATVRTRDGQVHRYKQHMPYGGHHAAISVPIAAGTSFEVSGEEDAQGNATLHFYTYKK